jgi:DNA-binding LytR/AlgR family response regulator
MQDFLFVKNERVYYKLKFSEILYIQAEKKYISIVTDGRSFMALTSISQIEKILPKDLFCRIHRSFIVSLENTIQFDGDLLIVGNKKIPISENYKKILQDALIIVNGDMRHF